MINFNGTWDYECFCKKNHVSYAGRQPASRQVDQMGFVNQVGGYRETCEPFECKPETKNVDPGFQLDSADKRYKVFIPSNTTETAPKAWEAAKQEVCTILLITDNKSVLSAWNWATYGIWLLFHQKKKWTASPAWQSVNTMHSGLASKNHGLVPALETFSMNQSVTHR